MYINPNEPTKLTTKKNRNEALQTMLHRRYAIILFFCHYYYYCCCQLERWNAIWCNSQIHFLILFDFHHFFTLKILNIVVVTMCRTYTFCLNWRYILKAAKSILKSICMLCICARCALQTPNIYIKYFIRIRG